MDFIYLYNQGQSTRTEQFLWQEPMAVATLIHHTKSMKNILFCFLLFGHYLSAQTTFYIAPLIHKKLYFCTTQGDVRFGPYAEHNPIDLQNPYYAFSAKRVSTRPAIELGLRGLVSFQGGKQLLSLEWSSDGTGTMSKTAGLGTSNLQGSPDPPPPYKTYSTGVSYFQTGVVVSRISVNYALRLSNPSKASKFYVLFDVSVTGRNSLRQSWRYDNWPENTATYYHNDAREVYSEIDAAGYGTRNLLYGFGLKSDVVIHTKRKNHYLFSLETVFRQGVFFNFSSSHTTLINDNGKYVAFVNGLASKGSGIYFQLSRNFQIFPWRPKRSKTN